MKNKIIIAGGRGFLGKLAADHFLQQNWEVVVLSRTASPTTSTAREVQWNGRTQGSWVQELEGSQLLLNLSGRTVDCRYTHANKQEILNSRLQSTHCLSEAVAQCARPPQLWINASSATYYQHAYQPQDEYHGQAGSGFSVEVVQAWEKAFFEKQHPGVRKVALRLGIVLGPEEGAFVPLKRLAQLGVAQLGPGNQYISWLHQEDWVRMLQFIVDAPQAAGVFNATAPQPVPNRYFMQQLKKEVGLLPLPFSLPTPLLELGARIIQTETELILKSRCVVPRRLQELRYPFAYPQLAGALRQLANPKQQPA